MHDYQSVNADDAGLEPIRFLVGTDNVGVPMLDVAIYLEGDRLIASTPAPRGTNTADGASRLLEKSDPRYRNLRLRAPKLCRRFGRAE